MPYYRFFYGATGKNLQRYYKDYISDFNNWNQKLHAKYYLLFPQNIRIQLAIDHENKAISKAKEENKTHKTALYFYVIALNSY